MEDNYEPLSKYLPFADKAQALTLGRMRRHVVRTLKSRGAREVLDLCCGTGAQSRLLARAGFNVTGVDASPTMLARAIALGGGPEYSQMDATALPYRQKFDAAVVALALHEMTPEIRKEVWLGMRNAICPGGLLLAVDYTLPKNPGMLSRLASHIINGDERAFLKIHPPHYQNFQTFMAQGGLKGWLTEQGEILTSEQHFLFGNLGVLGVELPT